MSEALWFGCLALAFVGGALMLWSEAARRREREASRAFVRVQILVAAIDTGFPVRLVGTSPALATGLETSRRDAVLDRLAASPVLGHGEPVGSVRAV